MKVYIIYKVHIYFDDERYQDGAFIEFDKVFCEKEKAEKYFLTKVYNTQYAGGSSFLIKEMDVKE